MAKVYRKPGAVNAVSVTLVLFFFGAAYAGASAFPAFRLNSAVKGLLEDSIVKVYRANLQGEPVASRESAKVRYDLIDKIRGMGIADPKLDIRVGRDAKKVFLQATYRQKIELLWLEKHVDLGFSPRAETSAERVEWE